MSLGGGQALPRNMNQRTITASVVVSLALWLSAVYFGNIVVSGAVSLWAR